MGWRDHVSDAVYLALCAAFEIDPDSSDGLKKFVPAYIKDTTNVQAPRNLDLCYYSLSLMPDSMFNYIQVLHPSRNEDRTKLVKTIPVSVLLTFYGDGADDESEHFWSAFQFDSGPESARAILRKRNIVPYGEPGRPALVFEVEGTYQRRRCDVRFNLAYLEITEKAVGYVGQAPEIGIVSDFEQITPLPVDDNIVKFIQEFIVERVQERTVESLET